MKKKILGLLFMIFSANSASGDEISESVVVTLTRREKDDLKAFFMYGYDKNESYLANLDTFTIDYWADLMSRHIQVLENKILQNKSGWKSMGVLKGLGWVAGSIFGGWLIYAQSQGLTTGSFGNVDISDYQMSNISSIKFSRSEKKKLDLLDEARIANGYTLKRNVSPYWYYRLNELSPENWSKLHYLALRLACRKAKEAMLVGLGMSAVCATAAAYQFYKVTRYAERLVERLERDKRALELLQNQKDIRLGRFYSQ
jgi:hypothetical protein